MTHGGKRPGSGRPKGISTKILDRQADAAKMCEQLGGDEGWAEIYQLAKRKKDYRTMLDIKKYWTDKRDGKAAQALNVKHQDPIQIIFKRDPETPAIQTPSKPQV